jgi:hypothetical protein
MLRQIYAGYEISKNIRHILIPIEITRRDLNSVLFILRSILINNLITFKFQARFVFSVLPRIRRSGSKYEWMRSELFQSMKIRIALFWVMTPCILAGR